MSMKAFGMLGMIITLAVIGWWLAESLSVKTQDGTSTQSYSSAIDDAHTAADQLEGN